MKMNRKSPYGDIGRENYWQIVRWRFLHHHPACTSLVALVVTCAAAILASVITFYDLDAIAGPLGAPPGAGFLLGTGQIGRDMFSRLLYVTRISLLVGVLATAISMTIGVSPGLLGGYFGGWLDVTIVRLMDMVMSFPYVLPVLMVAATFEPGLWSIILILGFVDWLGTARLVRGDVLSLREANFVKSSIVAGMLARHILSSEILPSTVAPILMYTTSVTALSMLDEASLSFLRMGVQPPTVSLGNMLNSAQSLTVLTKQPWFRIPPGFLIVVLVVAINLVGDALRDTLNPPVVLNLGGAELDAEDRDAEDQEMVDSI